MRSIAGELMRECAKDDVPQRSAAIAFYAIFSLPALLLVILSLSGTFIGGERVEAELFSRLEAYIGNDAITLLQTAYLNLQDQRIDTWVGWLGAVLLIVASVNLIFQLRRTLNGILELSRSSRPSLLRRLIGYVMSLLIVLSASFLLISSVVIGSIASYLGQRIGSIAWIPLDFIAVLNHTATFLLLTILLFLLYLFLPYRRYPLLPVLATAVGVSALFLIGTGLFSWYIATAGIGEVYGAAAAVLILLFWLYYSVNVFLLGGEVIDVACRKR